MAERDDLQRGVAALQLDLSAATLDRLLHYIALLQKWNSAYNLTAVRDPREMVSRHLLDSLAVTRFVHGAQIADVGTGAGLPGIPLALALPEKNFELLDSNGKKIRFVTQAIAELKMDNARAIQCRVESFEPARRYDAILSRAFASLADMAACCAHMLAPGGALLALKGTYPDAELQALPPRYRVDACHALGVPGEVGERHLIEIRLQQ